MLESLIQQRFLDAVKKLRVLGYPIKFINIHGGAWTSGEPDCVGAYKGQCYCIEFKGPKGKATKRQEEALRQWSDTGTITMISRDWREALGKIDPELLKEFPERVKSKTENKQAIPKSFDREGG